MDNRNEQMSKDFLRKQKIRERYKGIGEDMLEVIPAAPQEDFYRSETPKRVAVYAEEADIFANQMRNVKPLLPIEIFNANCEAGNDKELMIRGLIESYDLKITASSAPGSVCAVSTLEAIYDKYGYEMLDHVIRLIVMTWEGEQKSFSANILNGVSRLLYAYGDSIKDDTFKEKLGEVSIKEITKIAKERRAGSLGYAEAMLIFYCKKMKNALPWNMLYSNKPKERTKNNKLNTTVDIDTSNNTAGS